MDVFAQAEKQATPKSKSSKKKADFIKFPEQSDNIKRYIEILDEMDNLKAELESIEDSLKDAGKKQWVKLYKDSQKKPANFYMQTNDESSRLMLIIQDKYITIDAERAGVLVEKYGKAIISEDVKYTINPEFIANADYRKELSALIEKSKVIAKEDKSKVISAEKKIGIVKGAITKLTEFSKNISELVDDIAPVLQLKRGED